jgi:hypothetical protein
MSDLEVEAEGIMKPMLRGREVRLDYQQQMVLRAWITLRAMIFEHASAAPNARHFYGDEERRRFADVEREGSLEPLDGAYIWLFYYRSQRWVARSNVANLGMHEPPGEPPRNMQVITGVVGRLGFQMLVARWPGRRRLRMDSPHVQQWRGATNLLCPHSDDALTWPPDGGYLDDELTEEFMDRFNEGVMLTRL